MEDRSAPSTRWDGTWESLPPKRRRFFLWAFLWVVILDTVFRAVLELAGVPAPAAAALTAAGTLILLVPLGRAAWQELAERRSRGEELPPRPMTGRRLAGWAAWTVVSWAAFTAILLWQKEPFFPGLPLILTGVTVYGFHRWKREKAAHVSGRGPGPEDTGSEDTGSEAGER